MFIARVLYHVSGRGATGKTAAFTLSAMSYVKALLASGSEAEKYAVTAIYRYAEAAKAYAQATNQI